MKEWMEPIDSELPLAKVFNRIISDLELLRIMTNPRIFSDSTDKEAPFRMHNYYLTVLWERWLHGVFNRLVEWADTISTFFDEYNGSWEYYAFLLNAILHDTTSILNLHLDQTRFFKYSNSGLPKHKTSFMPS